MKKKPAAPRQKKTRMLFACYSCPREHPGWSRHKLRVRGHAFYCLDHFSVLEKSVWPRCPSCNGDEWRFVWGGNVADTTVACYICDVAMPAVSLFDELTVNVMAKPIVRDDQY